MRLHALLSAIENTVHRLSRAIRLVSQATLFVMMFLVTAGVIARYIFLRPIKGDLEIQELMMVLIVFLALPYCQLEKGNVFVEILVRRLSGRPRALLHCFAYLIGFIIIALIVWQTGVRAINGFSAFNQHVTLSLWIPITPFLVVATIGLALMGLEWFIELVYTVRRAIDSLRMNEPGVSAGEISGSKQP